MTDYAPNIPDWLLGLLPPVQPPDVMFCQGDDIMLRRANGVVNLGTDFKEAYAQANVLTDNMEFDPELVDKYADGERLTDGFFFIPSDFGSQLIMATTDAEKLRRIEWTYEKWLKVYEQWRQDKTKFMSAYHMVSMHPAFWTRANRIKASDPRWTPEELWEWNTGDYAGKMWIRPASSQQMPEEYYFMAEAGGHIANPERWHGGKLVQILGDYTETYHDLRLDVYAKTYEGAFIEMALLVDKFFAPDGTERENVEYEKSPLERDLDKATEELEEYLAQREDEKPEKIVKYADYHQWLLENEDVLDDDL